MLHIAPTAHVSHLADVEDSVRGSTLTIEAGVRIDSFVKIKCTGGNGDLLIGENSYINSGTVIYTGNGIRIGRYVLIGPNCTLAPTNHAFQRRDQLIMAQRFMPSKGGIIIEDDVWLGAGVTVLDGAIIRKGAVVGACSLVRGELDSYGIYHGVPAKKQGERT